ncbi:hypothetical protein DIPPA_16820 [Diplonema papillatum]|nr:hypothetical protein DIPPA_16820 [Diplonema papillatum]
MQLIRAAWLAVPVVVGLTLLIVWLATGAAEPWGPGWQVAVPFVVFLPVWAAVAAKLWETDAEAGGKSWKGFPATAYLTMTAIVLVWSVSFAAPGSVLAKPKICGPIPSTCQSTFLVMSEACNDVAAVNINLINFSGSVDNPYTFNVYTTYSDCWKCKPRRIFHRSVTVPPTGSNLIERAFYLPTAHGITEMTIEFGPEGLQLPSYTLTHLHPGNQGVYQLNAYSTRLATWFTLDEVESSWSSTVPLATLLTCLVVLYAAWAVGNKIADHMLDGAGFSEAVGICWSSCSRAPGGYTSLAVEMDSGANVNARELGEKAPSSKRARVKALDVLRGSSLVVMNVANYGGMGYWWLDHSKWDGLTVADLVFPWFVWIMGVAMAVAFEGKRLGEGGRSLAFLHVVRRSATLFSVGLLLSTSDGLTSFADLRIPNVLQRFALSYFVSALCILFVPKKPASGTYDAIDSGVEDPMSDAVEPTLWADIRKNTWSWLDPSLRELPIFAAVSCLWLVITFSASFTRDGHDCPAGYLGPGGVSENGMHFNCTGGIANYIDSKMFGPRHMYSGCFPCDTYMDYDVATGRCDYTVGHDPEGFLGALNSVVLCWLGVVTGRIVRDTAGKRRATAFWLAALGFAQCLTAACLCGFQQFGGAIPVNKNLWSFSFILLMSGSGTFLLLFFLATVDWWRLWQGKPFLFVGMNSILYYAMHEALQNYVPFSAPQDGMLTKAMQVISVALGVATNVTVVYWLYRNKLFLKI